MRKDQKIKLIFLSIMIGLLLVDMVLIAVFPNLYTLISFVCLIIILYIGMHLIQSLTNKYVCPECNHKFKINLFKDIFIRTKGSLGKNLTCPNCHKKQYMKEEN